MKKDIEYTDLFPTFLNHCTVSLFDHPEYLFMTVTVNTKGQKGRGRSMGVGGVVIVFNKKTENHSRVQLDVWGDQCFNETDTRTYYQHSLQLARRK